MNSTAPSPIGGILWMMLAAVFFSVAYGVVRYLSDTFHSAETVFLRQVFGIIVLLPWILRSGIGMLRVHKLKVHFARAVVGYLAMVASYHSVTLLPLADAIALQFTLPIFTTIFAMLILKEIVPGYRWAAIGIGFLGALIIIRPGFAEFNMGIAYALGAAVFFGLSDTGAKYLSSLSAATVLVFYNFLLQLPVALPAAIYVWVTPTWADAPALLLFCVASLGAQICLTRAFANADASLVSPVLYIRLPMVAVIGYFFFGQVTDIWTWIGAAILFAGTFYSARRASKAPRAAVEAI